MDNSAEIIQIIAMTFSRGVGTPEDPRRDVLAYRKLNGELLVEMDPAAPGPVVGASPRYEIHRLDQGDERILTLRVRATVVDSADEDGAGLCYELQLEHRAFAAGRIVQVDADEIIDVGLVSR